MSAVTDKQGWRRHSGGVGDDWLAHD